MQRNELPHDIVLDIQRILDLKNPEDPLDELGDFDSIETINSLFPNEEALGQLAVVQDNLKQQQRELQAEILSLQHELQKNQDPGRMQLIQELISDLLSQMNRIREKATESEAIVQNITRDIQVLDLAKKNLTLSITLLRRFQMIVNALNQLDGTVHMRDYFETARTLSAMKELSLFFKEYTSIPRVAALFRRIQAIQGELRTYLDSDFDAYFLQDPQKPVTTQVISEACLVVDVLGDDVRKHFTDRYCALELKEYRRIFRSSDEAGQLDNISRRFSWFSKLLDHHESAGRVFPEHWEVEQVLCAKFTEITQEDVKVALTKAAPSMTVALLLESMQTALEFENSISTKYGVPFSSIVTKGSTVGRALTISSVFEPHLHIFVDAQDKALADMLAPSRGSKSRASLEAQAGEPTTVLPSSTELFYFYGQNLEQCAKFSVRKPLFELCTLHKKWLTLYAEDVLISSMKRSDRERRSLDGRFAELRNACIILNTADYCQSTAMELEDKIKEKISEEYREQVTLQAERDLFVSVISVAILALLKELESATDAAFSAMQRSQWGNLDTVSGQSQYATDLVKAIDSVVEEVRGDIVQKKYLRNFYDKAANLLITRFTNSLVKSRPLKEVGAEQVLIDLQALKACLLRFPQALEGSALSASFARGVTKSMTRLETLLKTVNSPVDPPEGFVQNYTLFVGDSSFSNFQKVLDLKGLPRSQQNTLLDTFLASTSIMRDLESTSFLTTLDMDPPVNQSLVSSLGSGLNTPTGSSINLPSLLNAGSTAGILSGMSTPPLGSATAGVDSSRGGTGDGKREVFSDLRRLVSFAVRRERETPNT